LSGNRTVAKKTSKKKTSKAKATRKKAAATTRKKSSTTKARKSSKTKTVTAKKTRASTTTKKTASAKKKTSSAPAKRKKAARVAAEATPPVLPDTNETGPKAPTRAEGKLSRRDVEQFRQILLRKRAEILGDVSTLHNEALNRNRQDAAGDLSSMPIHMADLGTDNYELEFTLGLIEGERSILKEIDEALERIEKGTYGFCLATGKPIGKARLKARPWARYCYEYSLAQERGQTGRL